MQFFSLHFFEVVFAHGPLRGLFYAQEIVMPTSSLRRGVHAMLLALSLGAAAPSFALPLMDMRAEDLLPMATELRKSLNLNANQQTLWQQVESRSRSVLRERQSRREHMQQQAAAMLGKPNVELRELNALIEAEAGLSAAEDKQLRELWLTVNDALDDSQRGKVAALVTEQLQRVPAANQQRGGGEREKGEGGERRRGGGMGHGRGGIGAGMGGPGA
jgi:hypothetical protein